MRRKPLGRGGGGGNPNHPLYRKGKGFTINGTKLKLSCHANDGLNLQIQSDQF